MSEAECFDASHDADEHRYTWTALDCVIRVAQVRDGQYGLTGEVRIQSAEPNERTGRPTHVYFGQVNLSKLDDRDRLAKALAAKNAGIPWVDLLEVVRLETMEAARRGEPTVRLRDVDTAPQVHLIERILPMGETSVFFGDGASGKSLIAAAMVLAVASGAPVGPFVPCFQGPVLVLDYETTPREWAARLHRLSAGQGLDAIPEEIEYRAMWRPLAAELPAVRREVARLRAELVVVDSIALAVGGDVTADTSVPFFNALRSLPDTTRLVVSHVSKSTSRTERGAGDPYGSVFVKNFARSAWAVQRDEVDTADGFETGLTHRKVNGGPLRAPIGVRLRFRDPGGAIGIESVEAMSRPGLAMHARLADQIAVALRSGAMSSKTLAEETGASEKVVRETARRMLTRGQLVRQDAHRTGGRGKTAVYGLAAFQSRD